jgi:hypothetical protein
MRFKPFTQGKDRLEMGRLYRTHKGNDVGPFDERQEIPGAPEGQETPICYSFKIGEDRDGDPIWANWWDTGTCGCENAEELGEIIAVEVSTVEEGMK